MKPGQQQSYPCTYVSDAELCEWQWSNAVGTWMFGIVAETATKRTLPIGSCTARPVNMLAVLECLQAEHGRLPYSK